MLRVLLGWMVFSFILGALTKFYWGDTWFGPAYSIKFTEWGYPSWFRFFVGAGELLAALMLLNPRLRFLGAGILVVITSGAVATHIASQDPISQSVSAPVHLALALIIAYVAWPSDWLDLLTGRQSHRDRKETAA
jgi:uncharacterized membrane protein YphA (DoxX/SURF4 family)